MAAVLEQHKDQPQNPGARFGSQVDEQIAQATSRIRAHDLTFGALSLAALTAFYATAMIVLDRYLRLDEWLRQLALLAFIAAFATATYRLIILPLRRRINPLYAAAKVEQTIENAKNSVMGYVEAQENGEVHNAVKAAMSARAAKAVGDADVNEAIDHRSLVVVGSIFIFFLLSLVVLFFLFRPGQFKSLVGRSFVPFTSSAIESQTQLTLVKPDPFEPTITNGQTITVAVHVGGKVPAKDSPKRVRVLIRHNQADPDFEEIPMAEGETTRDWQVKIPEDQVLNGFWYKVAAGDAETPEYRVTVRSLPLFTDFEASYVYPAYTNKAPDKGRGPTIRALRGTRVALVAHTNRDVREGTMKFEAAGLPKVAAKTIPNQTDSLLFEFTVKEATKYKLYMTTTSGEVTESPWNAVTIDADLPPSVQITKPEEEETVLPANGLLAVNATVGDDYGIEKVRLRVRVDGRELAPIPYMGGQSFKRAKDNTWPKDLVYKDSADLAKLKYDDGKPFEAREGMLLDYWVEAIDNCSEARPVPDWDNLAGNVGSSRVQRMRLTAAKMGAEDKQELERDKGERKNEEKQHNQAQQQKFNNEKREPQKQNGGSEKQGENQSGNDANSKGGEQQPQDPMKNPADPKNPSNNNNADPKNPDPKNPNNADPKNPDPKNPNSQNSANGGMGKNDPTMPPKNSDPKMPPEPKGMDMQPPMGGDNQGMSEKGGMDTKPNPAPMPNPADNKKTEDQAREVQKELDKTNRPEGEAKPNPSAAPEERTEPAKQKPKPMDGGGQDEAPKEQSKTEEPMNGGKGGASESKPQGGIEKPTDPAMQKPNPQDAKGPKPNDEQPSETRDEPLGGTPGQEKSEPKMDGAKPKETPKNQDPKSGSTSKPATEEKNDSGSSEGNKDPMSKDQQAAAKAGKSKPNNDPARGQEKDPAEAKGGGSGEDKPGEDTPARAKPEKSAQSGAAKSKPSDPMMDQGKSENKPAPGDMNPSDPKGGAAEAKPDQSSKPMEGGEKNTEKSLDKSPPKGGQNAPDKKELDPKQMEELKNAARDLNSSDPKKQQEARNKLDQSVGEEKRKELEQLQKDLQSPDKATREAAEKKVNDIMKEQQKQGGGDDDQKKRDAKAEELKNAARDLNSSDPKKQQEARDKLDQSIGEEKRKELEQLKKDLQSPDKATREAAEKKVNDMVKDQQKKGGGGDEKLNDKQIEDIKNEAKDLSSSDPKKQQGARDKLDKSIGQDKRKAIEEMQKKEKQELDEIEKDLKSNDPGRQQAAKKKLEDKLKKAQEDARNTDEAGGEPSPEEIADLTKKAKDLASKDQATREKAEAEFDEKLGKDEREKIQEKIEDEIKKHGEPKNLDDLSKEIKNARKRMRGDKMLPRIADNPNNRAKTAELQLEEFKKNRYNKDLQDKLHWTQQEYDNFLAAQEKRVEQLKKEAAAFEQRAKKPDGTPVTPTLHTDQGGKVEARDNPNKGNATGSGAVVAPPGFEDAKKKFAEEANKRAAELLPKK